ncbi:MAG: photosynthetic reaction center cytochrome c subunit family protein [Myxococcales bacterium]
MPTRLLLGFPLLLLGACRALPPAAPPPPSDAASVLTAAGVEMPRGMTWPAEVRARPARRTFKNVRALAGISSERFMAAMQSMKANVGLECRECHVQDDFPSDEKKPKLRAREMMRMTARINLDLFGGEPVVTCFTCHLGKAVPEAPALPAAHLPDPRPTPLLPGDAERPANEIYANVQVFDDVTAGRLLPIMSLMTRWLGVDCAHCHAGAGRWQSDEDPAKRRARQMLLMTSDVARIFYGGSSPIGCATCHRGGVRPVRAP